MGEHKLKDIVFYCIKDSHKMRPCAERLTKLFRCESEKIQQKERIVEGGETAIIKVAVLGESGVGKSSLLLRYSDQIFMEIVPPTCGLDFKNSKIRLHDREFTLKIVDTAGQEVFQAMTPQFIRKVQGIAIVYDVTEESSLTEGIPRMYQLIKDYAPDNVSLILVGNKAGEGERVITREEGENFAKKLGISHIETSAKTGLNVEEMFSIIASEIYDNLDLSDIDMYFSDGRDVIKVRNDDPPRERGFLEKISDCFKPGWNWLRGRNDSQRDQARTQWYC